MIPYQREYETTGMGQTRIYVYVVMLPLPYPFSFSYLTYMQNELCIKYPVKVVPDRPAQTERELQWFKVFFQPPDNPTTNSYRYSYTKQGGMEL